MMLLHTNKIMEHKKHTVFFVFVVALLFWVVDVVTASKSVTAMSTVRRSRRLSGMVKDQVGHDICAGQEWWESKQVKSPCPKLVVWVPNKTAFTEFVDVNQKSEVELGGFSIAIFCRALHLLPFNVQPIFKVFKNSTGGRGTYDQLVQKIEGKSSMPTVDSSLAIIFIFNYPHFLFFSFLIGAFNKIVQTCEAVAGDVTVRHNRTQYIDFTSPYLSSEVYMLVRASHQWNQTLWTFLKPFSRRLWITIVCICIYIGLAIAFLEYRVSNPKFMVPIPQRLVMMIWFPISTIFFHEGKILNKNTKVVLVMWLSMIFIIIQIFTATLSAWLTLDQMRPELPSSCDNVGYQEASFLEDFIKQKCNCSGTKLKPLKTVEEYEKALSTGKVDAIYDELPYIELFLAKYGSDYMKYGPINQESGIAFAFPHRSPMLYDVSKAVINVTESDIMMDMKKKYLGFHIPDGSQPNQALPQSLDIQSFIGLFIFIGTLTIAAIIFSEISLRRVDIKIVQTSTEE